jgi:hypothetical protein
MIAVISVLAVSIVAPTFGLTFHSHQSLIQTERDSDSGGGSIFDIDWD